MKKFLMPISLLFLINSCSMQKVDQGLTDQETKLKNPFEQILQNRGPININQRYLTIEFPRENLDTLYQFPEIYTYICKKAFPIIYGIRTDYVTENDETMKIYCKGKQDISKFI